MIYKQLIKKQFTNHIHITLMSVPTSSLHNLSKPVNQKTTMVSQSHVIALSLQTLNYALGWRGLNRAQHTKNANMTANMDPKPRTFDQESSTSTTRSPCWYLHV